MENKEKEHKSVEINKEIHLQEKYVKIKIEEKGDNEY